MDRITTQMTSQMMLADINNSLARVTQTQNELSSGRKVNQPSDDPYGASLAVSLNGQIASLNQYSRNISDAQAWTQASDSSLMSIEQMTQRVRELVVQAGGGTLDASSRANVAAEVDQLTESVKQEANTQYNGQYIFSGTATTTKPYGTTDTYSGDSGSVLRQIGAGTTIPINTDISQVLGNGTGAADGKLLDTLRTISTDLRANNQNALMTTDLRRLDTNLNTISTAQAQVGATENRLTLAASRVQDLRIGENQELSNTQDADMSQLMIDFSTQQNAYTAALKASATIVQTSLLDFLK